MAASVAGCISGDYGGIAGDSLPALRNRRLSIHCDHDGDLRRRSGAVACGTQPGSGSGKRSRSRPALCQRIDRGRRSVRAAGYCGGAARGPGVPISPLPARLFPVWSQDHGKLERKQHIRDSHVRAPRGFTVLLCTQKDGLASRFRAKNAAGIRLNERTAPVGVISSYLRDDPGMAYFPGNQTRCAVNKRLAVLSVGMLFLFAALPSFAHHGTAGYDMAKVETVTGTVTKVDWSNPHIVIHLDAKDASGNLQHWSLELSAPLLMTRLGWTKDSIKAGDQ